ESAWTIWIRCWRSPTEVLCPSLQGLIPTGLGIAPASACERVLTLFCRVIRTWGAVVVFFAFLLASVWIAWRIRAAVVAEGNDSGIWPERGPGASFFVASGTAMSFTTRRCSTPLLAPQLLSLCRCCIHLCGRWQGGAGY
ncbi:hypothetical protein TcCL_ESM08394, partial [Trypanosoma cruzi]